jgi:hypothetical protein
MVAQARQVALGRGAGGGAQDFVEDDLPICCMVA